MTTTPPAPPWPSWADPNQTWDDLIVQMRFWLKPGDEMFTDQQLMMLMSTAQSFARAVVAGWNYKLRMYADPNRPTSVQIGNESMTWGSPAEREKRDQRLLDRIKRELGISSGGSRVLKLDEYPQVYGVTPYRTTPYPEVLPPTWTGEAQSVEFDLTRSGGGTNQFYEPPPPPTPTPYVEPEPEPKPRPTVRPRPNKPK